MSVPDVPRGGDLEGPLGAAARVLVSDADRNRFADVIGDAFAEGRLTRDEYEDRLTVTMGARTVADLGRVSNEGLQPGDDCGQDDGGAVVDGVFVESGGQSAPLLDGVERAFDDVAALVGLGVQGGWAPALGAAVLAVADLVVTLGDHGLDAAAGQREPVGSGAVGLVAEHRVGAGAGPAWPGAGHA